MSGHPSSVKWYPVATMCDDGIFRDRGPSGDGRTLLAGLKYLNNNITPALGRPG